MDTTYYYYYPYIPISCVFFLLLYKFPSPWLSAKFCPGYLSLSHAKQIAWNTRIGSNVHSFLTSATCIYVLLYEPEVSADPVWCEARIVKYTCAIVVGYMLSDTLLMLVHYKEVGELFYIFHHIAAIYAYYFVMTYGVLGWFANFRMLAELSTPFVNQRWFMDVLGCSKSSRLFMINGIAMAATFFLFRIACMPTYWFTVYSVYGDVQLGKIYFVLVSSCVVLDSINLYWMYKIYRGAKKVLKINRDQNRNTIDRKAA